VKVLFLEIDTERDWAVASIGPAFIAAFVRRQGHQAEMLRVRPEMSAAEVYDRFTRLRERIYLDRFAGPAGGEAQVVEQLRRCAAAG